ncbi:MAG: hypothetical protein ACT4OY_04680 [Alphaproteobacteria bacterium]
MPKILARKFADRAQWNIESQTRAKIWGTTSGSLAHSLGVIHSEIFSALPYEIRTLDRQPYPYRVDCGSVEVLIDDAKQISFGNGSLHYGAITEKTTGYMIALSGEIRKHSFFSGCHAFTLPEDQTLALEATHRMKAAVESFIEEYKNLDSLKTQAWDNAYKATNNSDMAHTNPAYLQAEGNLQDWVVSHVDCAPEKVVCVRPLFLIAPAIAATPI